jgi:hypothetical protein
VHIEVSTTSFLKLSIHLTNERSTHVKLLQIWDIPKTNSLNVSLSAQKYASFMKGFSSTYVLCTESPHFQNQPCPSSLVKQMRDIERLEGPALGSALVFRWCKISGEATPYGPRLCIQLPRNIRHFCVSVWATVL